MSKYTKMNRTSFFLIKTLSGVFLITNFFFQHLSTTSAHGKKPVTYLTCSMLIYISGVFKKYTINSSVFRTILVYFKMRFTDNSEIGLYHIYVSFRDTCNLWLGCCKSEQARHQAAMFLWDKLRKKTGARVSVLTCSTLLMIHSL